MIGGWETRCLFLSFGLENPFLWYGFRIHTRFKSQKRLNTARMWCMCALSHPKKNTHCMIHAFSLVLAIHMNFFIWSVFILHLFFLLPLPFSFPRHTENVLSDLTENFFNESKIHIKFCGNKNETTAILFLLFFFSFQREEHLLQIICITLENSSSKTSNKMETDGANGSG